MLSEDLMLKNVSADIHDQTTKRKIQSRRIVSAWLQKFT